MNIYYTAWRTLYTHWSHTGGLHSCKVYITLGTFSSIRVGHFSAWKHVQYTTIIMLFSSFALYNVVQKITKVRTFRHHVTVFTIDFS